VPRGLLDHARRAASACPTLALLVDKTAAEHR
jgi:ferredoxin